MSEKLNPLLEEVVTVLWPENVEDSPVPPTLIDFLQTGGSSPVSMPGTGATIAPRKLSLPIIQQGLLQPSIQGLLESLRLQYSEEAVREDDDDYIGSSPTSGGILSPSHSPGHISAYLNRGPRHSVSADSTGEVLGRLFEGKPPQGFAEAARALLILRNSAILSSLSTEALMPIVSHMRELVLAEAGMNVTMDSSPVIFVETGELECEKICKGKVHLATVSSGQVLSEMSVIYNCPYEVLRLTSLTPNCILWSIDKDYFEFFLRNSAVQKGQRHLQFLQSVPILQAMDTDELIKLCAALQALRFRQGDVIVGEGTHGSTFYIIESGTCSAETNGSVVKQYNAGDHFGEMALLQNEPRTTSVIAVSDEVVVLSIDRKAFKRLLGPIEAKLLRNMKHDVVHED